MCILCRSLSFVRWNLKRNIYQVLISHYFSASPYIHNNQSQSYTFHSEALYTFSMFYVPVPV